MASDTGSSDPRRESAKAGEPERYGFDAITAAISESQQRQRCEQGVATMDRGEEISLMVLRIQALDQYDDVKETLVLPFQPDQQTIAQMAESKNVGHMHFDEWLVQYMDMANSSGSNKCIDGLLRFITSNAIKQRWFRWAK